jgi:hypothetical protein
MNFIWRLRLFTGGELARLAGWIIPKVEGSSECDERADWVIWGKNFDDVTYACTDHLLDMITAETVRIERQGPPTLNVLGHMCCYSYAAEQEEFVEIEQLEGK